MSQLFTVILKRKHIVSQFNGPGGKKSGEIETLLEEKYCDLPAKTAQMYREKFPNADVQIIQQVVVLGDGPRVSFDGQKARAVKVERDPGFHLNHKRNDNKKVEPRREAKKPEAVGDYASVVNSMMENT